MGTLRWAINQVDSDTGPFPDTIDFNIPGTGPFTIQPTSPLPAISNPVIINGYSEPNSSTNTLGQGDNAVILIDLNGSNAGYSDGLDLDAGNSVVEGLAINQFSSAIHLESLGDDDITGDFLGTDPTGENAENNSLGVFVDNVGDNTIGGLTPDARDIISANYYEGIQINGSNATANLIAGDYIGTDATGTNRLPNGMGLEFQNGSWGNTVGGAQSGAGNLVSGNNGDAIKIDGGCHDNVVQGNLVGTDVTGEYDLINYGNGVDINGDSNTIGGTTPGAGNVLSGNSGDGIVLVFGSASYNLMAGNLIGTDVTGTQPIPNSSEGINLFFSASYNTIGGTVAGAGNIIAFNQAQGVGIGFGPTDQCVGDAILSNSIFGNGRLGIDLGNDGVTPNSPGSPHTGANNLQSFPVLNEAVAFTGLSTVVAGSLNSAPDATFTLQFFSNPTADPSGYGQGQTLLGTTTVTTDANGNASFQASFPVVVSAGDAVSATATDSSGDTSEFARDVLAVAGTPPVEAFDDTYFADENTTLTVPAPGVQANDVSADGGSFTSVLVSPPGDGDLTFNSDGSFSYTPDTNFTGLDSFTYQDVENGQDSNVATVTLFVNPLTVDVTNTLDDGSPGSLPWAINIANSDPSSQPVTIDFDIPGSGPFVIQPTTPLPAIEHSVIIDGYSQPGASPNTLGQGDNAVILIDLNGSSLSNSDGLDIDAGNSVVEGLAINQFSSAIHLESLGGDDITGDFLGTDPTGENGENNSLGVFVDDVGGNTIGGLTPDARDIISANSYEGVQINGSNATGNLIAGDYIGTDATGTNRLPNGTGLEFQNNSWGNTVGGAQSGAGNLVSGNNGDAIKIDGGCHDNVVQGNLVGTDVTGEYDLINYGNGVDINGDSNTIGGTSPGSGNVLSGNGGDGIVLVFGSASYNLMAGNLIGTDVTGTQPLGNSSEGINLFFSASDNTIGGTVAGAGNIIAFNQAQGVGIGFGPTDQCVGDAILSNSIFGNGRLGIDLGNDGVTPNSPGSPHTGANNLQSFPVLNEAVAFTGLSTVVAGSLNSAADSTFTLQFFSDPTADPSGYGQGQTLLGTTTVTTDSNGNASFEASFPVVVSSGYAISATATDSSGDTSEFSQDVFVVSAAPPIAALNDNYNTDINTTLKVAAPGVQANDIAADGGSFISIQLSSPKHGTLTFNSDGSFTYVPKTGYTGTDSFTYEDDENGRYSNVATVTISVNPKTLFVTNTGSSGAGSLFQALTIASSSNSPGADTILFNIPGNGPFEISLSQALPAITHPTIINGYSQPGSHKNSSAVGDNAVIEIQIDGSNLPNGSSGLVLASGGITVEGLSLTRFGDAAILVQGPGSDAITGDFLGVNPSGTGYGWGDQFGVEITGASANTIGGSVANRDVISDNYQAGLQLESGSSANLIAGDYIGTDVTGVNRLGNGYGIALYDSPDTTIGGTTSQAGNVISANNNDGIYVSSLDNGPGSTDTLIEGNEIGIEATGSIGLGNGNNGVHIAYGAGTVVGGLSPSARNVISGNQAGVYLENSATDILIEGNDIGTDPRGFKAIGNQYDGVLLSGTLNTVGGTVAGAGNLISGNGRNGISDGSYAGSIGLNTIEGNLIGTDSAGTVALPNGQNGVDIASYGDTVGGTIAGGRNLISGNADYGIRISGGGSDNLVEGNDIGTAKNGTGSLGNGQDGVHIQDNATANTIGGTVAGAANLIEFNGGAGVAVGDNAQFNPILTNSIDSNGDLGINLSGDGNQDLQPPTLASAVSTGKKTTIVGSLSGFAADTVYLIQFFSNKVADPSGFGEGQKYLGSLQVTTDDTGSASFQVVFNPAVPMGDSVSAMATDPSNDTSGFAADVIVSKSDALSNSVARTPAAAAVDAFGALSWLLNEPDDAIVTDLAVDQVLTKRRPVGPALPAEHT